MKIKLFNEFINEELTKFISGYKGTGKPKFVEWIHDDNPISTKSNSSGLLLKKQLIDQEIKNLYDNLPQNKDEMDRFKAPQTYKKALKAFNNIEFLKYKKSQGELKCEYCGKSPLTIYGKGGLGGLKNLLIKKGHNIFSKFDLSLVRDGYKGNDAATVDHKQPISKGGKIFDYNNLAVCCKDCNEKKRDMSYEEWMKLISDKS